MSKPWKFSYLSHLIVLLFGQWIARQSLRDLVFSLNRYISKFYHLGLTAVIRYSRPIPMNGA